MTSKCYRENCGQPPKTEKSLNFDTCVEHVFRCTLNELNYKDNFLFMDYGVKSLSFLLFSPLLLVSIWIYKVKSISDCVLF